MSFFGYDHWKLASPDDDLARSLSRSVPSRRDRRIAEVDDWYDRMVRLTEDLEQSGGISLDLFDQILAELEAFHAEKVQLIEREEGVC